MRCPKCGTFVKDSARVLECRKTENSHSIRRRRQCGACGHRFTTREFTEKEVNDLLILRDLLFSREAAADAVCFIESMMEDLKTAVYNCKKLKEVIKKNQENKETILFGINGGKHD
tara:strand:- start:194 stop:541 length:348 start_codon:yes stop_codon:yes gene_type:complete